MRSDRAGIDTVVVVVQDRNGTREYRSPSVKSMMRPRIMQILAVYNAGASKSSSVCMMYGGTALWSYDDSMRPVYPIA